ncbi:hypothetical protein AXE80_13050 [Wenyingzhuangia fucanilytica]|uniref:DUF4837 domain-containing protein n=1 Tax=Wenyingzhuangia fucanilytica TaxID=1790137 RepID=A0A1B1Y8R7_9FLAO|nr:DUF4837 family protein [Wenyingzhuangia fucanilytica]ANW97156.1 hypothetical protein AXE80_13050 [Wenyingzhuangia fucanilytica]
MKKIFTLFTFLLIVACGGKEGKKSNNDYMKPGSTGRINHVIVVVEPEVWKGEAGKALREVIQQPIAGLPQTEYQFGVSTIPGSAFTKMFKNSRNLLFLQLADKEVFQSSSDKYAQPQTILEVKAPTTEELVTLIHEKANEIVNTFKDEDLKSVQEEFQKNKRSQKINALEKLGVSMDIPNKYRTVIDTLGSFMWMRSHISGGIASGDQTNNIIAYQVSLFDENKPFLEQMIKNRDSIGKMYIRGNDVDKMYMITEAARKPSVKITTIDGKKAYESRGTWEVFGAFSAGPFLNYSIIDEKNNRVLVIEGFNYAPSVNKRDFVFELEAILKTIKFN